ncbi:UNVERIFIED_CONTAM: hypothetical protein K2H54_037465 [Gekko kuhli]
MALKCPLVQLSQGYKKTAAERLEEFALKVTEHEKEFAGKAAQYQREIRHLQWLLQDRQETLDQVLQQKNASRKPDKTAKSPHKPTARPTKEKKKPGKGTTGTSDAPSGPPEPKRPRKTTPVPTTVSSASVRPSDSTSAPARPSDSEILTVEDPRYRHSDPELPPTDDRRSPAAHLSDIMLVPSRSPSLCSQPPSELFESDDARAPVYPDRQDWYRDTENVASFYGSRSRSRHPSLRYSPEARSPSPNTYARYYYASRYRPYPRPSGPNRTSTSASCTSTSCASNPVSHTCLRFSWSSSSLTSRPVRADRPTSIHARRPY